jgi:hypothetical protein
MSARVIAAAVLSVARWRASEWRDSGRFVSTIAANVFVYSAEGASPTILLQHRGATGP